MGPSVARALAAVALVDTEAPLRTSAAILADIGAAIAALRSVRALEESATAKLEAEIAMARSEQHESAEDTAPPLPIDAAALDALEHWTGDITLR